MAVPTMGNRDLTADATGQDGSPGGRLGFARRDLKTSLLVWLLCRQLSFESVHWLQRRYRWLYAIVGIVMVIVLLAR